MHGLRVLGELGAAVIDLLASGLFVPHPDGSGRPVPMPAALRGPKPSQRALDAQLVACGLTTLDELHADDERRAYEQLRAADLEVQRNRHKASARKRRGR